MGSLRSQMSLIAAVVAGLCWAATLALLLYGGLAGPGGFFAPPRLLFYALLLAAGLLTFIPLERSLELPGLSVEGVTGTALLLYCLAFVPAPREWLLSLPDLPVYALLITALFLCGAAVSRPFIFALSRRLYRERARALDIRRVRRQSYEIGLLLAAAAALAGLRVLTWVSLLLLGVALVIAELLLLSRVEAEVG